jgi:hypothetical protein
MKSKREVSGSPLANGDGKMSAARNGKLARPFELPHSREPLDSPAISARRSWPSGIDRSSHGVRASDS